MKNLMILNLSCLLIFISVLSSEASAIVAVQRSVNSSIEKFKFYINSIHGIEFSQAYLEMAEKMDTSAVSVETCLEQTYIGRPDSVECMKAVKALSLRPLNREAREILFALLTKIEDSKQMDIFRQLKIGLMLTHPEIRESFAIKQKPATKNESFLKLEWQAWKKLIQKKISGQDYQLLVNGKLIKTDSSWIPSAGVFQWSLVTNTHKPMIIISTFAKFAAESAQGLEAFADNCRSLDDYEIQKMGVLEVQVFASPQCVAKEKSDYQMPREHLGSLPAQKTASSFSSKSWIWPTLALLGLGIASSLKGKQVQVSWPSINQSN